jgi:hypothetical protein
LPHIRQPDKTMASTASSVAVCLGAILLLVVVVLVLDLLRLTLFIANFIPQAGRNTAWNEGDNEEVLIDTTPERPGDARRPVRTEPFPTALNVALRLGAWGNPEDWQFRRDRR